MNEQGILVADKDTAFLREVADHFSDAGYQVETTIFAGTGLFAVASDFDKKINLLELVRLLKKCNRHLAVILVSDEASLPIVKRIRQEGVFYYALRPVTSEDTNEIKQAIECALKAA